MKALVGALNQEKALVGAFSIIVKTGCGTDGALHSTRNLFHSQVPGRAEINQQATVLSINIDRGHKRCNL